MSNTFHTHILATTTIVLFIAIILVFIHTYQYTYPSMFHIQESYDTRSSTTDIRTTYWCLGDSILNNSNYVPIGESVEDYLKKHTTIYMGAKDNARVSDVIHQIPSTTTNTNIEHRSDGGSDKISVILSVGGNDLLKLTDISVVYTQYIQLVRYLTTVTTNGGIVYLMNLYYPPDESMHIFYPIIQEWNSKLQTYTKTPTNNVTLIDISRVITEPSDVTDLIEPSVSGGLKLTTHILHSI